MFYLKFLLPALAVFQIATSLPLEEKIEPVDLAHNCLDPKQNEGKSPVLLLHGLGGSQRNWIGVDLLLAISTKRKVCTVDLRNHGNSPWNNRTDVAVLAWDIGHFLDQKGIKKVNIIGHSLGGKIAVHYTLNNPDRVNSIVVEDNRPNTVSKEALFQVSFLFQILKGALASIPEGSNEDEAKKSIIDFLNKKFEEMGSTEKFPESILNTMEIILADGKWRFKFNMDLLEEALKHPESFLTESSGLYEGPALFIYGTNSPFKVNEDKENILKLFPKANLVPVEGATHFIHGIFREFNDEVIKFLNEVD